MANSKKILHITGQLDHSGISSWLKSFIGVNDKSRFNVDICCNYRQGEGPLSKEFKKLGCRVWHIPLTLNFMAYHDKLLELIKRENYEIVHDHRGRDLSGITLRVSYKAGVQVRLAMLHGIENELPKDPIRLFFLLMFRRWSRKYATNIVGVSESTMNGIFGQKWRNDNRYSYVYNCVPEYQADPGTRSRFRNTMGIQDDTPVIGLIGRFTHVKNPFGALRVIERVLEADARTHVVWIGDGILWTDIKKELGLKLWKDRVHLIGAQSNAQAYMQMFDVFFLPSFSETFSLTKMEALQAGLPIVASDCPGIVETFPEHMIKYCKNANDIKGFADLLLSIVSNIPPREIPHSFLARFRPDSFYEQLTSIYNK